MNEHEYAERLAKQALALGAIRLNPEHPFTWASGYRMPIYNDNRQFLSDWQSRALIADAFTSFLAEDGFDPDNIAGTSTAGIPHATTLADRLKKPLSYVRSSNKSHGLRQKIEGLRDGSYHDASVLLIEDLISTGGSSISAVQAITEAGGHCPRCYAIFTYGLQASVDNFAALDPPCKVRAILDYDTVLYWAEKTGYVTKTQAAILASWRHDPFGWGAAHGFPKEDPA